MQVDELRIELSYLTDVCAQAFEMLEEMRPQDDEIQNVFNQYEATLINISKLLDAASARTSQVVLPFTPVKKRGRGQNQTPYDKESLLVFLRE